MQTESEHEILDRVRRGDREALETLIRLHLGRVHAICARICISPQDAEDATQEALIAVARGAMTFDGRSSFSTWVHRVATNACLDEVRRIRRRPLPSEHTDTAAAPEECEPPARAEGTELQAELAEALRALPEEFRIAVVLRDVADREYAEIAEILELKVGTVKSRIARGRAQLAETLAVKGISNAGTGTNRGAGSSEGKESR